MLVLPLVAALWGLMPNPAAADTFFTYSLGVGNSAISGFPGPYATATVDLNSAGTSATITFTSLTNSGNIYLMGDGGSVAVNVNGAYTLGSITGSNSGTGFTPGPYSDGGSGNEDGFGSFNQTINSFDGYTHSSDTISVVIDKSSGTWSDASLVLTPNSDGYSVAAHIFVTSSPADASNGALATGFAANGTVVPEPSSLALGLLGVMGLGLAGLRRLVRRNPLALA